MPIDPVDRTRLSGTGVSEAHAKSLLDKIDETISAVNNVAVGGGGVGWIYCSDLAADGVGEVSDKTYQDANNTVLQSAVASTGNLLVEVRAGYPLIRVNGAEHSLPRDAGGGFFTGDVPIVLSASGDVLLEAISPDGIVGATDSFSVAIDAPPTITSASFTGGYPGAQTEVKQGDNFDVQITADKEFDRVRVLDYQACELNETAVSVGTSKTIAATIADRGNVATPRVGRVQVRSATTGAWSAAVDTSNTVICNNLYPTASFGSPDYPGVQTALKDSEQATVPLTVADYDSLVVAPIGSELVVIDDTPPSLTVQRSSGTYNVATQNLRATATRNANDAITIDNAVVSIAHVDPVITVVEPAVRLRSGGNDGTSIQSHTITIQSNQQLLSAPSLEADSGGDRGTFIGSWAGGPSNWTRVLQVHDNDEKGTFAWEGLVATNRAGKVVNVISGDSSYTLGGFVQRNATFPAFEDLAPINVETVDYSKISFGTISQTNQPAVKQPIGTSPPVVNGMTIVATGVDPTQVRWLDTDQVAANTGAPLAYVPVQETV